jgi:hypothetical protein
MLLPTPAHAGTGHENQCTVTNINWSPGALNLVCASGTVYTAFQNGNVNAGSCATVDIDTLKIYESLAIAARVSGLVMTVWYDNTCGVTTGIITSLELKGN